MRLIVLLVTCVAAFDVFAHAGERAFVLLLPTRLYIVGGTLVVALSFACVLFLPRHWTPRARREPADDCEGPLWASMLALGVVLALVVAGHVGSRDPLANPLPLVVWSLWWVGLTFLHVLFGNLWSLMDPWRALALAIWLIPGAHRLQRNYPAWLGYWPAVAGYLVFAWFELVYPAPQDPALLANAVLCYLAYTLLGMTFFGTTAWLRQGDPFTVFFRMVAWLAPVRWSSRGPSLGWPGWQLLQVAAVPVSAVVFVLLVLSSVSFDGLSRSFWWLALAGENPLEFPGRTAMLRFNSVGLLATLAAFLAAYAITVRSGAWLARRPRGSDTSGFVLAIIPIAFGYHFAHYLPAFLVNAQYAARALSDPFQLGWDLFGTADLTVKASFLTYHASVEVIWNLQTGAIVLAHVGAVLLAHLFALRDSRDRHALVMGQLPGLCLMILYTMFGLWLLSTPIAA